MPWIKNSSGGGPRPGHATPEDIQLLRQNLRPGYARQGIRRYRTLEQVLALIQAAPNCWAPAMLSQFSKVRMSTDGY